MENTKNLSLPPITQTITVGYKTEPVYTFDELSKDVQRQLIDDEVKQRKEEGFNYFPWLDENFDSFKKTAEVLNIETEMETDEYADEISQDIIHFFSSQSVQEELSGRGDYWTKDGGPIVAANVKEVPADV